jgi:hypothetical protein
MSRALMAGSTDYSHQSFDDMVEDLKDWLKSLKEVYGYLEENSSLLDKGDYWKNVDYDVQATLRYSSKFFNTSIVEIDSIISDFEFEVKPNHISRIKSLSRTASELNIELGKVWHEEPWEYNKEFGNPNFQILERMYGEARDMAVDMIDLSNLAGRLRDFIGYQPGVRKVKDEKPSVVFNMQGQHVGNQYIASNDINQTFNTIMEWKQVPIELKKLHEVLHETIGQEKDYEHITVEVEGHLEQALTEAEQPQPNKKSILQSLTEAKALIEGIASAAMLVTAIMQAAALVRSFIK